MRKIVCGGRDSAIEQFDAVVELYRIVFGGPPYFEGAEHVARFRELLTTELDRPGFTLAQALDGDTLIGMVYGYPMVSGEWWTDAHILPDPKLVAAGKLAVMEFAVHPDHQNRGLGRALMDEVLRGRPEPFAVLCANPGAPAREIYRRWGWREAGCRMTNGDDPVDVLYLALA
ncbi:GNAT family N-acetyltransferase [Nocardia sp. NPDC049149]|uniref:GNAT family N-acetyltransferase n=1 Tax=Nocardia sp. NPDC049149 TaxID=3364315 RepID=UPI00372134E4